MSRYVVKAYQTSARLGSRWGKFGAFTTREAAEQCVANLAQRENVEQCVIEDHGNGPQKERSKEIEPKGSGIADEAATFLQIGRTS